MKMVKSLLLGSAAGLIAVAGAQAADLPVKAKPVEYVKVCSIYGAGFYYIPGTDTCIKVGGFVRAEYNFNAGGSHGPYFNGAFANDTRQDTNNYVSRVRGIVSFDSRSQTEWGTLRAYIRAGWELNSQDANYRGVQYFDRAFIQFAGLTVGKTQSFFDFYANAVNYTTLAISNDTNHGINLIAYTASFGGGFSATVSLEENQHRRVDLHDPFNGAALAVNPLPFGAAVAAPNYGRYAASRYPDIVANLRVDQPWGSAQIMGAVHDASGGCAGGICGPGREYNDATGFAIGGGIKFNVPWAAGDAFWVQATYANGAVSYLGFNNNNGWGMFTRYSNSGAAPGDIGSVGIGQPMDGIINPLNGNVELTEGFQVNAAFEHYWTPALRTSVFGGYAEQTYSATGAAVYCATAVAGALLATPQGLVPQANGAFNCDPNFSVTQVGSRTIWSPVRNLDIGVEVLYTKLDQNHVGSWFLPTNGSRVAGLYTARDQDIWSGILRFQRNFWP